VAAEDTAKIQVVRGRHDPSFDPGEPEHAHNGVPDSRGQALDVGQVALDTKADEFAVLFCDVMGRQKETVPFAAPNGLHSEGLFIGKAFCCRTREFAPTVARSGRIEGDIEFRDVVFGYDDNKPVLHHVSFQATPGTLTALVGSSGSGKSTIVDWLVWQFTRVEETAFTKRLGRLIPVPLILRDLGIDKDLTWDSLLDQFLKRPVAKAFQQDRARLEEYLSRGQGLILIDGLDEVGDLESRRKLVQAIWQGVARFPGCLWLATSRIVGYDAAPLHFSKEDVASFVGAIAEVGTAAWAKQRHLLAPIAWAMRKPTSSLAAGMARSFLPEAMGFSVRACGR
jgi:hypothetical protein